MKVTTLRILCASALTGAVLSLPGVSLAQTAHYPVGVEGIKGSTLPPPGIYFRDYNYGYFSSSLNDAGGHKISGADFNASVYANIPRLIWITDAQILGGNIGVDALLPLPYTHMEANTPGGRFDDSSFGIGDVFAEMTWSAHTKQFDFALGAGFWAPSGDFDATNPTEPGKGYWTPMFTAGLTWYVDSEKKWAVSALSRWEINTEQEDTDIRPGTAYTLEWGISRALSQTVDLGVVGYYQTQVNKDQGAGASSAQDSVAGVGPEVSVFYPKSTFGWSLRYLYEFMAQDRPQGHTFVLTMTKRF